MADILPTPEQKLAAMFNARRVELGKATIDLTNFNFGTPSAYSGPLSTSTTRLYVFPQLPAPAVGRVSMFYSRINLSAIDNMRVTKGSATSVSQLIDQISQELGLTLTIADFVEAALPASGTFSLTASGSNKLYTGTTNVTLM